MTPRTEMMYFGEKWDAPLTDQAERTDTPVGQLCMGCQEAIQDGDSGLLYPTGFVQHKECGLRMATGGIGHLVNHEHFCKGELGTDAGLSPRASAKLVWEWVVNGRRYGMADLGFMYYLQQEPQE